MQEVRIYRHLSLKNGTFVLDANPEGKEFVRDALCFKKNQRLGSSESILKIL